MIPIEIIALIFIIVAVIKILVILSKPEAWVNFVKKFWNVPILTSGICLVLAGVVLYYLIQSGMTIVQIFAVTGFISLLMGAGIGIYAKEVIGVAVKLMKKGIMKKAWLYTLIWMILLIWGLKELFW